MLNSNLWHCVARRHPTPGAILLLVTWARQYLESRLQRAEWRGPTLVFNENNVFIMTRKQRKHHSSLHVLVLHFLVLLLVLIFCLYTLLTRRESSWP